MIREQAQGIIDSYSHFPDIKAVRDSLSEELAKIIVTHVMDKQEDFMRFDFEGFFKSLNLKKFDTPIN